MPLRTQTRLQDTVPRPCRGPGLGGPHRFPALERSCAGLTCGAGGQLGAGAGCSCVGRRGPCPYTSFNGPFTDCAASTKPEVRHVAFRGGAGLLAQLWGGDPEIRSVL